MRINLPHAVNVRYNEVMRGEDGEPRMVPVRNASTGQMEEKPQVYEGIVYLGPGFHDLTRYEESDHLVGHWCLSRFQVSEDGQPVERAPANTRLTAMATIVPRPPTLRDRSKQNQEVPARADTALPEESRAPAQQAREARARAIREELEAEARDAVDREFQRRLAQLGDDSPISGTHEGADEGMAQERLADDREAARPTPGRDGGNTNVAEAIRGHQTGATGQSQRAHLSEEARPTTRPDEAGRRQNEQDKQAADQAAKDKEKDKK